MIGQDEPRDLAALVVPQAGWLEHAEDSWEPSRLRDPAGALVGPVAAFLWDLQASGRPETTLGAYAIALLRWYRFLWAAGVLWDQATRAEARDFSRWIQITIKPGRAGRPDDAADAGSAARAAGVRGGVPNPVRGKAPPCRGYAPTTAAHSESSFALLRLPSRGRNRPDGQPVPAGPGAARAGACASQPDGALPRRAFGRYRPPACPAAPRTTSRRRRSSISCSPPWAAPRPCPGGVLGVHRARASELLGATCRDADPGSS